MYKLRVFGTTLLLLLVGLVGSYALTKPVCVQAMEKRVVAEGGKHCVRDSRKIERSEAFGCFDTKEEAEEELRAILMGDEATYRGCLARREAHWSVDGVASKLGYP